MLVDFSLGYLELQIIKFFFLSEFRKTEILILMHLIF